MDGGSNMKHDLSAHLDAVSADLRLLLDNVDVKVPAQGGVPSQLVTVPSITSLDSVLEQITRREEQIESFVQIAIAMKRRQKEIREAEAELERYKSETDTLQAKLIEAEKILELSLHHAKEKLKATKQSRDGTVSPEDLISYAHKISLASSIVSPVGWQPNDSRRPYPQDMDMRKGFLGRLSKSELAGGEGKDGGSGMKLSLPPAKPVLQGPAASGRVPSLYGTTGTHTLENASFMTEDSSSSSEDDS